MKNLTLRLFVVLMVVFLCIGLSACDLVGGGKAPDDPSTEDPAPEQPGQTPEQPGETPEQPGETPEQPGETPEQPGQTPEDPDETPSACAHVLGETVAVPATCTTDGYTAKKCSLCKEEYEKTTLSAPGHTYGAWCENTATCTEAGTEKRYCTVANCGGFETRDTTALNHAPISHEGKAPTCTEDGYTAYVTCSRCDYNTKEVLGAEGHTYGAWCENTATCTEAGTEKRYCTVANCGDFETRDTAALEHDYVDGKCDICGLGVSEGLEYSLSSDGTYYIVSIGTCTDTDIVIPSVYEGLPVKEIGSSAFRFCARLTSVTIGNGVTTIGSSAFDYCTNLTSVTIPDSVTYIGSSAFYYCTSLTSIVIPNSVTTIGTDAFDGCFRLVEVINKSSLPISAGSSSYGYVGYYAKVVHSGESQIVNLNDYLFITANGVHYLVGYVGAETDLVLPTNYNGENYEINKYAFRDCQSFTSITLPDSVTTIGFCAFSGCDSLTSVTIPSSVQTIGDYAFSGCTSLKEVTFAENSQLLTIGDSAFYNCTSLTSITIPSSAKTIGEYAFEDCTSLKEVTFAKNSQLLTIGSYAFEYCRSLTSIVIPNSVTTIGYEAFYGCTSLTSVVFKNTSGWKVFTSETATSGNSVDVTDASTAATYLKSTYHNYYWRRS